MNILNDIKLDNEYIISKINGTWGLRKKIKKLGLECGKRIVFIKSKKNNSYIVKIIDTNKKIIFPICYFSHIQIIDTNLPNYKELLTKELSNIKINIFSSSSNSIATYITDNNKLNYNNYNFTINHLPFITSIYGDDYQNKRVRSLILQGTDVFLGLLDANNLEADLFLSTQFIDSDAKIVLAVNSFNKEVHGNINFSYLSELLGIPILVFSNEITEDDISKLYETITNTYNNTETLLRRVNVNYGRYVEQSISKITAKVKKNSCCNFNISPRYLALNLLERDNLVINHLANETLALKLKNTANAEIKKLESLYDDHIFNIIKNARKAYTIGALSEVSNKIISDTPLTTKIDKILTHKYWGILFFIAFMALTFYSTFELGKYPMQWLDKGVELLSSYIDNNMAEGFWKDLIINGAIDGVGGVLIFIPNIFILFFFIGILENTGYMSRAAFIMDKYMHKIGLHGKSFIPMIMGFGCTVPAIMSTRILDNKRDKILTMLILPFMSCSARLPVYILLISAFFPEQPVLVLACIYLFGILLALIISKFFSKTILSQKESPYIMELSEYRRPTFKILFSYTWSRGKEYLKKIGGIILIGSIIIWLLGYFPTNINYSKDYDNLIKNAKTEAEIKHFELQRNSEKHEKSYIGQIGHIIEPIMRPLGFDWKMSVSILAGIAGKEITVSTMGVLYQADENENSSVSLQNKLKSENYAYGSNIGKPVFNKLVALSFMIFVLIYFPCIAVFSAIWKESKLKWAIFSAIYTTAIAWLTSFAIYQIGSLII